ncbi:MAG TPA: UPF0149 family protein [Cellvibrionaceae bacterium]
MVAPSINFEHWADFLFQLGAVSGPAEFQGFLVGLNVNGQDLNDEQWQQAAVAFLDIEALPKTPEQLAGLNALNSMVAHSLADAEYRFRLLLPDDALPLVARVEALAQWCQGFLFALGQAGAESVKHEGLEDLAQIAQLELSTEECEENEVYFAELVEYIRVVVLELAAEHGSVNTSSAPDPQLH